MMKKGIGLAAIFLAMLVMLMTVPVSADVSMDTGVSIQAGTSQPPTIMAKWEQDTTISLEDGDVDHLIPGSQFLPPMVFDGTKTICYYAIVTDPEMGGDLPLVSAYVYHPENAYFIPDPEAKDPYLKYQVILHKVEDKEAGIALAEAAYSAGLVTLQNGITWTGDDGTSVEYKLGKGTAAVYVGCEDIHYCQPAGDYKVIMRASDAQAVGAVPLENYFNYLAVPCAEFDFESINYGSTILAPNADFHTWFTGNVVWSYLDGLPTVRNIGNVPINVVIVYQDSMGFGQSTEGWDVTYDARMGDNGIVAFYEPVEDGAPGQNVVLEDALWMCHSEELDFSIHVVKGYAEDTYEGDITLGYQTAFPPEISP